MRISELKSPYKELAELRREWNGENLENAFNWIDTPEGDEFWARVDDGKYPPIPAESLKELEGDWVIGQEYEFSDGGEWHKGMLLAIVDHNFKYITFVDNSPYPVGYKQIRHIQPQIKEVTIEEIAEKFGVSVESIKIKK